MGRVERLTVVGPLLYHPLTFLAFIPTPFSLNDTEVGRAARLITAGPLLNLNLPFKVLISTPISHADTQLTAAGHFSNTSSRSGVWFNTHRPR
jgi:hypothetical protein